jgi:hypothetical protein
MADDDDWVGEPPEGRHTRDQAKPDFWRNQWQAIVATSILGVLVIVVVIIALLRVGLLLDRPPHDVRQRPDGDLERDEEIEHRPAHPRGWYSGSGGTRAE